MGLGTIQYSARMLAGSELISQQVGIKDEIATDRTIVVADISGNEVHAAAATIDLLGEGEKNVSDHEQLLLLKHHVVSVSVDVDPCHSMAARACNSQQ